MLAQDSVAEIPIEGNKLCKWVFIRHIQAWPRPLRLQLRGNFVDIQEAIKVIRALADGLDPETNAALPEDSICRKALSVKALNRAVGSLIAQSEREQNRPTGAGRAWTGKEDAQVCEEVRKGMDFREIAKSHNRSVPAIVARLVKLGKISQQKLAQTNNPKAA